MIDLVQIKQELLKKHKQYEQDNPEEYRQGILAGLTVALHAIDELMEGEDRKQSQYYKED